MFDPGVGMVIGGFAANHHTNGSIFLLLTIRVIAMLLLTFTNKQSMLQWWSLLLSIFVIHNLEEIVFDMVGWGRTHRLTPWMQTAQASYAALQITPFRFGLLIIVLLLGIIATAFLLRDQPHAAWFGMSLYVGIMLVTFIGHVITSLYAGSAQPGVYSAVLLGMPVYGVVARELWHARAALPGGVEG